MRLATGVLVLIGIDNTRGYLCISVDSIDNVHGYWCVSVA